jgi:hypothetical protein
MILNMRTFCPHIQMLANIKEKLKPKKMTAVIGILNKQGVALAADSAVTVTGGNQKKIYNTANKIFTLSKFHPISIMIYSSSTLMQTPWEIIIKMYRKKLSDKSFDTVYEYKEDFMKFVKDNDYFTTEEGQLLYVKQFIYWNLSNQRKNIINKLSDDKSEEELKEEFVELYETELNEIIDSYSDGKSLLNEFKDYTLENFTAYLKLGIEEIIKLIFEEVVLPQKIIDLVIKQYHCILTSSNFIGAESGLVFAGFGEKEIYPSLVSINVAEAFDNKLRHYDFRNEKISDSNTGSIQPFAQTDVIDMFITGIDPNINNTYFKVFQDTLSKYHKFIAESIKDKDADLAEIIEKLDINDVSNEFIAEMNKVKRELQIVPTVDTVSILSKEDLSEMAESLIYLTYLKRRISSSEESVGGPIDVAIISKGDGFIWKKRKHYFSQELNKHFMANYFNK